MSAVIVMGGERRKKEVQDIEDITFNLADRPWPNKAPAKSESPEPETPKPGSGPTEPFSEDDKYAYEVQHFEDLKKTKKTTKKFYTDAKSIMKDLGISKTTFYKYLKLGDECPKNYILKKYA